MATEAVYKYLKAQNRPYSANDIVQNLHKEFGKTAVQKSLDQLVQDEKIKEKIYGKQKVYCIIQEESTNSSQLQSEMTLMEEEITKFQQILSSNEEKIKTTESQLKIYNNSLTTDDAKEEISKLMKHVDNLKTKLEDLQKNSVAIDPVEKKKIEENYDVILKAYKKRKRICMDIINSILEGYPKKKKDLFEEIGVETDEDVGFEVQLKK